MQIPTDIMVALIGLLGSAAGAFVGVVTSAKLTNYRIEQLEKKVDKHNTVIERTYKLEETQAVIQEQIKVANHRIGDLEKEREESNMDLSLFSNYAVAVIVGICLIIGYIAKKWVKDLDNKYIPTMVAILGAALNIWIAGSVSPDIILAGAFSGLASTGLHQAFKQMIEG